MCSSGYSSDNVLRLPAYIGPFNEPMGTDCYKHDAAFSGLAWFTIVAATVQAIIIGIELSRRKLPSSSLRFGLVGNLMSLIVSVIFSLLALYYPEGCFAAWAVFCFWLWFWSIAYMKLLLDGGIRIVTKITKRNMIDALGGGFVVVFALLTVVCCFVAVMVGSIGTAVYTWNQRNVPVAMAFWTLHCVGFGLFVAVSISYAFYLMGRFADLVELVTTDAKEMQQQHSGTSDNNVRAPSNQTATRKIEDVVHRFRHGRMGIFLSLPMGAGAWIVHAFVLPVFWYLVFIHLLNNVTGVLSLWYIYTPVTSKRRLINYLSCGVMFKDYRSTIHHQTGTLQGSAEAAEHGSPLPASRKTLVARASMCL